MGSLSVQSFCVQVCVLSLNSMSIPNSKLPWLAGREAKLGVFFCYKVFPLIAFRLLVSALTMAEHNRVGYAAAFAVMCPLPAGCGAYQCYCRYRVFQNTSAPNLPCPLNPNCNTKDWWISAIWSHTGIDPKQQF